MGGVGLGLLFRSSTGFWVIIELLPISRAMPGNEPVDPTYHLLLLHHATLQRANQSWHWSAMGWPGLAWNEIQNGQRPPEDYCLALEEPARKYLITTESQN